jgi:hypothetical protein
MDFTESMNASEAPAVGHKWALVHLPEGERSGASSEPLCDDPPETDRFRAPGRQHPIKDRHADGSLCLLRGETACAEPRPDQRLVAAHGRFDERALAIAGGGLPGKSPSFRNHFQMMIALCKLLLVAGFRRCQGGGARTIRRRPGIVASMRWFCNIMRQEPEFYHSGSERIHDAVGAPKIRHRIPG